MLKRREFGVGVSRLGGRLMLTLAVLSMASLSLTGCGKDGGGSGGGRTIIGFGLAFSEAGDPAHGAPPQDEHEFIISASEVETASGVTGPTTGFSNHTHLVTVPGGDLLTFGNGGGNISGPTGGAVGAGVASHTHTWSLGGN